MSQIVGLSLLRGQLIDDIDQNPQILPINMGCTEYWPPLVKTKNICFFFIHLLTSLSKKNFSTFTTTLQEGGGRVVGGVTARLMPEFLEVFKSSDCIRVE